MADTVTSQLIIDGPKNAVFLFTNISDGTGESDVTKIDVSTLSAGLAGKPCTSVSIDFIEFSTVSMGVQILEEATANNLIWEYTADVAGSNFFGDVGGIPANKAAGSTGNILFSTVGASNAASYSILMKVTKQY